MGFIPSGQCETATGGLGNDLNTFNRFVKLVIFQQSKHIVGGECGIRCAGNTQLLSKAFGLSTQMCLVQFVRGNSLPFRLLGLDEKWIVGWEGCFVGFFDFFKFSFKQNKFTF